ncbi:MAG: DUF3365 domain-containing protein [Planctomycetales bacterium]|nr:DUF3365 domain-containing protein [Planctomycetales bacterium]
MHHPSKAAAFFAVSFTTLCVVVLAAAQPPENTTARASEKTVGNDDADSETHHPINPARSVDEARGRARLLHETIRGTLQVMHRDFFDEDDARAIPSSSMEDVFKELSRGYDVDVKWLVVNTDIVNVDHQPADPFERDAAKALAKGKPSYETTESSDGKPGYRFRYAGPIHLRSQCLKCHVKRRTSNDDRVAGLVISMPLAQ